MKRIIYNTLYLPFTVLSLLFASCNQNEIDETGDSNTESDISLRISTRSTADGSTTEAGTPAENTYTDLRVMCFQSGMSIFDQTPVVSAGTTVFSPHRKADGMIDKALQEKLLLNPGQLVAIANAGETGITLPASNVPLADFSTISYPGVASATKLNYFDTNHHPVMVASTEHDFAVSATAGIGLERTCAKLRICVVNRTGDTGITGGVTPPAKDDNYLVDQFYATVLNVPSSQMLLRSDAGTPIITDPTVLINYPQAQANVYPETDAAGVTWPFYCYVNESNQQKITDTSLHTTVEIIVPYLTNAGAGTKNYYRYLLPLTQELKRNTIYELTVNIYGPGEASGAVRVNADIQIRIRNWDEITADPI